VNVYGDGWQSELEGSRPGFQWRRMRLAGELLGTSVYELPPGERTWPYHYHHGNEEWLVVIAGQPTLRTPEGERELGVGQVVSFPDGPEGAHQVINRSEEPVRVLLLSTLGVGGSSVYPDSGKVGVRSSEGALVFTRESAVDYWEGE
jgi:uncharacterized cupin superfamily protein